MHIALESARSPHAKPVFDRVEHLYTVTGALLRRFSDNIRIGGQVTYYRRLSTIPNDSYERWIYGLSAEIVP